MVHFQQFLLPELWSLVGQYAIRCEFCLHHFLKNGRCMKCPIKKFLDQNDYITWQMIASQEDSSIIFDSKRMNLVNYNFGQKEFAYGQKGYLANEQVYLRQSYLECNSTFIVYLMKIDLTNKNRKFLLLSDCLDHLDCWRNQWNHIGIFMYKKNWRRMTPQEIGTIFGDVFDWSWSKHRSDTAAFDSFRIKNAH